MHRVGIVVLCWVVVSRAAVAGTLDAFENAATTPPAPEQHKDHDAKHHEDGDGHILDGCVGEPLSTLCFITVGYGGVASWVRINPETTDSDIAVMPREVGEALIPFLRTDVAYERVESNLHAWDYRVEAGYGPLGVEFGQTRFTEEAPQDTMDFYRIHGLYRMSFGSFFEVDAGLGALTIAGNNRETQFSCALPVRVNLMNWAGLEFRPAWTKGVDDYDASLLLGWRYVSLKAGYRWVSAARGAHLDGPHAGLAVRF
jgi:hypothetical protein